MQLKTLSENSPVSSKKMGGKRGKRKTDSEETATVEELATNENLTVDETKENGVENGAKIEVSPKKHCSKATKESKLNGDQSFTPRRSRRKASESSVQSDVPSILPKKRNSPSIGSLTEETTEPPIVPTVPTVAAASATPTTTGGTKRKNSESGKTEAMSVADRIKLLSHDQNQKSTPPRTDSVLQLLLQGLNSKDKRILESVLERADDELINDTVKRLPLEAVLPLLEILHHYIQGKVSLVFSHGKWLKAVLQHHTSQIMSSPECEEILASMNTVIEGRTRNYAKILQLRGKLEMMVKQVQDQDDQFQPELNQASKEALLVYQDDSSDDLNDKLDEMLLPASDTDNDDWDTNEAADAESSDEALEDVVEVEDDNDDDIDDDDSDQDQVEVEDMVQVNGVKDGNEDSASDMDAEDDF